MIASIILAAGHGKRMKSSFPKVLHQLAGKPMLFYPIALCESLRITKKMVVIGHQADKIKEEIPGTENEIIYVYQHKQLGTAHAVLQTKPHLLDFQGMVLVLSGDVPLITESTIQELIDYHTRQKVSCTLLTARLKQPEGYGRIVRNQQGEISEIIEQADLNKEQESIGEINTGIYCFNAQELLAVLDDVNSNNRQQEYYLTDVVRLFIEKGYAVGNRAVQDCEEILGINDREELAFASHILYRRNALKHMQNGVTVVDPSSTFIESMVRIGQDTVIYPFSIITSNTLIGKHCQIGPYTHLIHSTVGSHTRIYSSVVENSLIGNHTTIGPYAHIRPDSVIEDEVKIGNYVEVKKSRIGKGTKAGHLTYLGDATLGKKVNIGAGTITCNFDGSKKNPTIIEDGAFIGSNNSLVAPVSIGTDSYTAAGSTITQDVPSQSLGIGRSRQKNIPGWTAKKNKKSHK